MSMSIRLAPSLKKKKKKIFFELDLDPGLAHLVEGHALLGALDVEHRGVVALVETRPVTGSPSCSVTFTSRLLVAPPVARQGQRPVDTR